MPIVAGTRVRINQLVTLAARVRAAVNAALVRVMAHHCIVEAFEAIVDDGLLHFRTEEKIALAHVLAIGARFGRRALANAGGLAFPAALARRVALDTARRRVVRPGQLVRSLDGWNPIGGNRAPVT